MHIDEAVTAELAALRAQIDRTDEQLIELLARRFRCTDQVGQLKYRHRLTAVDPLREQQQMARIRQLADAAGVAPALAEQLLRAVIDTVVDNHRRIGADDTQTNRGGLHDGSAA